MIYVVNTQKLSKLCTHIVASTLIKSEKCVSLVPFKIFDPFILAVIFILILNNCVFFVKLLQYFMIMLFGL